MDRRSHCGLELTSPASARARARSRTEAPAQPVQLRRTIGAMRPPLARHDTEHHDGRRLEVAAAAAAAARVMGFHTSATLLLAAAGCARARDEAALGVHG